jgi:hypothetical protein
VSKVLFQEILPASSQCRIDVILQDSPDFPRKKKQQSKFSGFLYPKNYFNKTEDLQSLPAFTYNCLVNCVETFNKLAISKKSEFAARFYNQRHLAAKHGNSLNKTENPSSPYPRALY